MSTMTLVDLLRAAFERDPDRTAYIFLDDGDAESARLTCASIDRRARAVAASLQATGRPGDRALLLHPSGPDFVSAYVGCLYAGVTPVPCYPPARRGADPRLSAIAADAGATWALTTDRVVATSERQIAAHPELRGMQWIATSGIDDRQGDAWRAPAITADTLALLQYTSGSTSQPRGVMVTHGNLIANLRDMDARWPHSPDSVIVSWLPVFHDMGLIYGLLQPLTGGFAAVMMPPAAFLQRPARWLRAITRYRGTHATAPNFAYDLCAARVTPEDHASIDLSSWGVAINGAEPVRHDTLERFARAFAPCGFDRRAFCPAFGLAESTLKVTSVGVDEEPRILHVDAADLGRRRVTLRSPADAGATAFVGCGTPVPDTLVRIVDPETRAICAPDAVGEIWVGGRIVAQGYWNNADATAETFHATLDDAGGQKFLRTGDLGFVEAGQLFVAGRLKDLIILHGINHYPQDIERTVEHCHPALAPAGTAAFSVDVSGGERLVVVAEIERTQLRRLDAADVFAAIRQAVSDEHGLAVRAIVLLQPKRLPKTSSGKVRRRACRAAFLAGELETCAAWSAGDAAVVARDIDAGGADNDRDEHAVRGWLVRRFAGRMGMPVSAIDPRASLSLYGMDSVDAVSLAGELEAWLGRPLSPTLVYDHPSIAALARHLAPRETHTSPPVRHDVARNAPIAVVGVGCRFPGARNPEEFWSLLRDGVDAVSPLPGVDLFDAEFFGIAPREADAIDPQQRLLLDVAWQGLEDAGIPADSLAGSATAVFVGIANSDYARMLIAQGEPGDIYLGTGSALSIAANRLSYQLDLRGPSLAIDSACSSSLVAVALACQSLRRGDCALAIAGGVNLVLSHEYTAAFSNANMMAANGRCKAFDASADGYVRGDGAGVAILKRLEDAERDGDRILAVVRGVAVNQDGRTTGLTAPNGPAQSEVITAALQDAAIPAARVSYVEAHGTGTPLGDPIEVHALKAVLLDGRGTGDICRIGSVKTNIGHLESAAGIAGFIKTVLALRHREIPASLHVREVNPRLEIRGTPLQIATRLTPWTSRDPRVAGVSSFGFGGTNAHVVLEEYAGSRPPADSATRDGVLTMSARDREALDELARQHVAFLDRQPAGGFNDICFSSNVGRSQMRERLSVVAASAPEARAALSTWLHRDDEFGGRPAGAAVCEGSADLGGASPPVVFLFTGQGSQYRGMGADLYRHEPVFRAAIDECDAILRPLLGAGLVDLLYGDGPAALDDMRVTQPAIFSLQVALTRLWGSWGVRPAAVMGHSLGEFAAAHAAGMLSLHDALSLVAARGRLLQSLPPDGAMVSTMADRASIEAAIAPWGDELSIAAVNGPASVVFSGRGVAAHAVAAPLSARGVKCTVLAISHASHSPLVEPILDEFASTASLAAFAPPSVPFVSNLTGAWKTDAPDAGYWRRHMREPVLFRDGLETLRAAGHRVFLEVGPHPTLSSIGEQFDTNGDGTWIASLHRDRQPRRQMLSALGALWTRGVGVDWHALDAGGERRKVSLPGYPFRRTRHWIRAAPAASRETRDPAAHPLIGRRLRLAASPDEIVFEGHVSASSPAWLGQHRAFGAAIAPTAAYVEMALAASGRTSNASVEGVVLLRPLPLDEAGHILQTVITPEGPDRSRWQIFSRPEAQGAQGEDRPWTLHATGLVCASPASPDRLKPAAAATLAAIDAEDFYSGLALRGLEIGPELRLLSEIRHGNGAATAVLRWPGPRGGADACAVDPRALDTVLQIAAAALPANEDRVFVQSGVERVQIGPSPLTDGPLVCRAHLRQSGVSPIVDLDVTSSAGACVIRIDGLSFSRVHRDEASYQIDWVESPRSPKADSTRAPRGWLIFADEAGTGVALADVLRARGDAPVIVRPGAGYSREADGSVRIRPAAGADYARLLDEVSRPASAPLAGLVHLWSLDAAPSISIDAANAATSTGAISAVLGLQSLLAGNATRARVHLVTRQAQAVGSPPSASGVLQSPLWGIGRNIALEHPDRWAGQIDLDDEGVKASAARLADELQDAGDALDDQVAFRGGHRYVARLVRSAPAPPAALTIRVNATYVVSGGLGALGLALASQLVARGARHLLLLSRSGASTDDRRLAIAALEAGGATVAAPAIDVADETAVRREVSRGSRPPVAGVIHAAGHPGQRPLRELTPDEIAAAFAPKVAGAIALRHATKDSALDFFLCISSMVSSWGAQRQAHYAAANHFLDVLSQHDRGAGRPFTTIGLGPLRGGMLPPAVADEMARMGVGAWTMDQAAAAAIGAIGGARAHLVAADVDWLRFRPVLETRGPRPLLDRMPVAVSSARGSRGALVERLERARPMERDRIVRDAVVREASRALGIDPARWPDERRGFFDLGMDSLTALELKKRLEHAAGRSLPATLVFDHPTVEALAAFLARTLFPAGVAQAMTSNTPAAGAAFPPADPDAALAATLERLERLVDRA